MQESGRLGASEQPRQLHLAPRGLEQIVAADDERDILDEIVHGCGELVRPVAFAIADEQIAALFVRALLPRPVTQVDEALDARIEADAQTAARPLGQAAVAARAGI